MTLKVMHAARPARCRLRATSWLTLILVFLGTAVGAQAQSFTITPASLALDYGKFAENTCTSGLDVVVTNTGAVNVPITSYSITPAPSPTAPFKLVNGWWPYQLPPASQIVYTIKFCPTSALLFSGTFTLNITGFDPIVVTLNGTGTSTSAISQLSTTALNFGSVPVGSTSAPQPITITNVGTTTMSLTSVWADPPFLLAGYNGKTQLTPGGSTTLQVYFQPSQPGSYPGNIFFGYDVVPDNGLSVNGTSTATSTFGITTFPTLISGTQGAAYFEPLTANGGTLPLKWSLAGGSSLPSGLTLSPTGAISGTISSSVAIGTYPFTVQVTDSSVPPQTVSAPLSLFIDAPTGANCSDITFYIPNTNNPLVPINDLGTGTFFGQQGGLYPNGSNVRPADHDASGVKLANGIVPLDVNGNPDPNGKYVLLSIGMSVAHIDFEGLVDRASTEPTVNPHLVIVNGAQPRGDADLFADPNNGFWNPIFSDFLPDSGVTPNQVVAAWVLDENPKPPGAFPANMQVLQANFESIAQNLHNKFPNLQIAYFLGRSYGGYSNGIGSAPDPEPISYEVSFGPKWAIADQLNGLLAMNFDPDKGPVVAPWVAWGPYIWANGLLPRKDGLAWSCQDFQPDGHHPDQYTGKWKDAGISLSFLKTDDTARPWFLAAGTLVLTSPSSLNFGNQNVGTTSSPQDVTLTNNQGLALDISSIGFLGPNATDFAQTNNCGFSLVVGGSCSVSVTFTPSAIGNRTATLNIVDDVPSSPQTVSVSGTGVNSSTPAVSLSPTSLTFASQILGSLSGGQKVTVTNIGTANLTIGSITATANFNETDTCIGVNIAPHGTCAITVRFDPTVPGVTTGAITLTDNAGGSPQLVSVSGTGSYPVTLTPAILIFAPQAVGTTSAPKSVTVTNNQSTALTFSYATSGDYSASPGGPNPCGASLAARSRCTLSVTFTPSYSGSIKGALTVTHNAAYSPQEVSLGGTGMGGQAPPLTFTPSIGILGSAVVGATSPNKAITVTNQGTSALNITGFSATGNFTATAGGTVQCGGSLAVNASCTILVSFSPTVPGAITGALTVNDSSPVTPQMLTLSATGLLPVAVSPTSVPFGVQAVGTISPPQVVTITNNQSSQLTLNSITASGDFLAVTAGANPCGATLAKLTSCTVGVEFVPNVTGAITGALSVNHNAPFNPQSVALSGTGQ
jgi:Putative Ig domain/Abnormal spindle-like microcephaly-assoc'd, ASPM-SPD-2-Hydin